MTPEALAETIDRHAAALVLFARQWCGGAEDVVQEAFVRLHGQRTPPDDSRAWLFACVRNGAISCGRAERRRRRREAVVGGRAPAWFDPDGDAGGLDAEAAVLALGRLPDEQRETVVAHLWGGLTFEAVGELTGVSAATAFRRYRAALEALRERLGVPCPTTR